MCAQLLSPFWFFATLWTVILYTWYSPGKNTGVDCYFLLQGIFLTQGSNPHLLCLLHFRQIPYCWRTGELKEKQKVKSLSRVWLFTTPWTIAYQAPLSMGFFQARILEWVVISSSRGSSWSRDQTCISSVSWKAPSFLYSVLKIILCNVGMDLRSKVREDWRPLK